MIHKIIILLLTLLVSFSVQAQTDSSKISIAPIDINELIKLKEADKYQQKVLIDFKNSQSTEDCLSVEEFKDHYKIIVEHPDTNNYTGGAEAYKVNKKTGKSEMIWHEHPMKFPEIKNQEEEKKKMKSNIINNLTS